MVAQQQGSAAIAQELAHMRDQRLAIGGRRAGNQQHALAGNAAQAIYAECGGLLYLGESIADREEVEHRMVGLIPIRAAMRSRLQRLGYSRIEPAGRGLWSQALRGHEFHYSDIVDDRSADAGWAPAWQRRRSRREGEPEAIGYRRGRIWASYVHAYWASNSQACAAFVDACCRETT